MTFACLWTIFLGKLGTIKNLHFPKLNWSHIFSRLIIKWPRQKPLFCFVCFGLYGLIRDNVLLFWQSKKHGPRPDFYNNYTRMYICISRYLIWCVLPPLLHFMTMERNRMHLLCCQHPITKKLQMSFMFHQRSILFMRSCYISVLAAANEKTKRIKSQKSNSKMKQEMTKLKCYSSRATQYS